MKGIKPNLIALSFLSSHNGSDIIYVVSLCQFFYLQARWFQNLAKLEDSYIASWKAGDQSILYDDDMRRAMNCMFPLES